MISASREDTENLGRALAKQLRAGDIVLLDGPMGAGKSELARGIARGLGITGSVPSPSFTILNCYDRGTVPLYHFDWWRVGDESELYDIGAEEYMGGDGICLIEWFEKGPSLLPENALRIIIRPTGDEEREITLVPLGDFRDITL
ncbi:MAG: tRNA (adenosine(37)-N6)-threonylcarbamoyltransferase complex ATPase subunit type 1 TsaE [Clostridiales bacterium]|jgi:ATPase, YjeE family|nr:tRNA (adenosine(37)-N6)-threonylcarbamoyltransferase complex ATPase subunit type 1 TsaE [Clostridiales bacterium]